LALPLPGPSRRPEPEQGISRYGAQAGRRAIRHLTLTVRHLFHSAAATSQRAMDSGQRTADSGYSSPNTDRRNSVLLASYARTHATFIARACIKQLHDRGGTPALLEITKLHANRPSNGHGLCRLDSMLLSIVRVYELGSRRPACRPPDTSQSFSKALPWCGGTRRCRCRRCCARLHRLTETCATSYGSSRIWRLAIGS
jgi:hypothetical protein